MRRLHTSIPELSHMRHIVQADTRVFVTNTAATVKNNVVYLIPPKRAAAKKGTDTDKATIDNIVAFTKHV